MDSWAPGTSFHDLLLDSIYHDSPFIDPQSDIESGPTLDFAQLQRGLNQIGVKASLVENPINGPRLTRFALTLGSVEDYESCGVVSRISRSRSASGQVHWR